MLHDANVVTAAASVREMKVLFGANARRASVLDVDSMSTSMRVVSEGN